MQFGTGDLSALFPPRPACSPCSSRTGSSLLFPLAPHLAHGFPTHIAFFSSPRWPATCFRPTLCLCSCLSVSSSEKLSLTAIYQTELVTQLLVLAPEYSCIFLCRNIHGAILTLHLLSLSPQKCKHHEDRDFFGSPHCLDQCLKDNQ